MLSLVAGLMLSLPSKPRYVVIDSAVRAELARDWNEKDRFQAERAYCVAWIISEQWGEPVYRVWAIAPAIIERSGPSSVIYDCPVDDHVAGLHVHPPTSCNVITCRLEGPDSRQCFASDIDMQVLNDSGEPFALVQCDRNAIVPYFPDEPIVRLPLPAGPDGWPYRGPPQ